MSEQQTDFDIEAAKARWNAVLGIEEKPKVTLAPKASKLLVGGLVGEVRQFRRRERIEVARKANLQSLKDLLKREKAEVERVKRTKGGADWLIAQREAARDAHSERQLVEHDIRHSWHI